jgi:hypothetical protein
MTKRELQEDNDDMRKKLEEAYGVIGDALGFDDDNEENPSRDNERDSEEDGEFDEEE